jgi:outer membrane protein assembly factor BamB
VRALVAAVLAVGVADWPQWRGPARDGALSAPLARAWPASLRPAWKAAAGIGHSSPVVAGGRVYLFARLGEEETLQAFDLASGRRLWQQGYPAPYRVNMAASAHGKGPKATPTVADGRVFTLGIDGVLSAYDAGAGRLLWRKAFGKELGASSPEFGAAQSPLVDGGRVIVHVGGSGGGALAAFDAATGALAWSWKGDGPGYASPVLATIGGARQVVSLTERHMVGLAADQGQLLWQIPFTTAYDQNVVTPVVLGDLVVYGGIDQPLRAVRVTRAGARWSTAPAWENAEVSVYMSTPVLAGGRLVGLSHRKKGQFFAVDPGSGRTLWLSEGRQGENAALVAAGTTVLALTTEAELLVADTAGPAFKVVQRYTVAESATWAHPAITADGVLVKDADSLAYLRF